VASTQFAKMHSLFEQIHSMNPLIPERKLYQDVCDECGGIGSVTSPKQKVCARCKGQGWTEGEYCPAVLCHACNGDGVTSVAVGCQKCSGRGFNVRIVQITYQRNQCTLCDSTGALRVECPTCSGRGTRVNPIRETTACFSCYGNGYIRTEACQACNGLGHTLEHIESPVIPRTAG
jgi:DnaJ-class molecular chaperone